MTLKQILERGERTSLPGRGKSVLGGGTANTKL